MLNHDWVSRPHILFFLVCAESALLYIGANETRRESRVRSSMIWIRKRSAARVDLAPMPTDHHCVSIVCVYVHARITSGWSFFYASRNINRVNAFMQQASSCICIHFCRAAPKKGWPSTELRRVTPDLYTRDKISIPLSFCFKILESRQTYKIFLMRPKELRTSI